MSMYENPQTGELQVDDTAAPYDPLSEQRKDGLPSRTAEPSHKTTERIPGQPREQMGPPSPYDTAKPFEPRTPDPSVWPVKGRRYHMSSQEKIYVLLLPVLMVVLAIVMVAVFLSVGASDTPATQQPDVGEETTTAVPNHENTDGLTPMVLGPVGEAKLAFSDSIQVIPLDSMNSKHAALADVSAGTVVASRLSNEKMYPASLTKVMTLVVAVEQLKYEEKLQEIITVSEDAVKRMQAEGASGAGLEAGEQLTVEAMLYALILKSDGVAACELANHIAGSEAAFADLMNQKVADMGLEGSHFVNATGLFDEQHYSTCHDMASIMVYAMQIPLCERILSAQSYVAPCTQPTGSVFNYTFYHSLLVSQFEKFKEQGKTYMPAGMTVVAGKTGYTPESGYCLVTCAKDAAGKLYVCVTAGAENYAKCVQDYLTVYEAYAK